MSWTIEKGWSERDMNGKRVRDDRRNVGVGIWWTDGRMDGTAKPTRRAKWDRWLPARWMEAIHGGSRRSGRDQWTNACLSRSRSLNKTTVPLEIFENILHLTHILITLSLSLFFSFFNWKNKIKNKIQICYFINPERWGNQLWENLK